MTKIKLFFGIILSILVSETACAQRTYRPDSIFHQMKNVADWQWRVLETNGWKNSKKDWTSGVMYTGMIAWAQLANDESYYQKLIQVGKDNNWKIGKYRHFADDYCVGQLYSQLCLIYKEQEYINDFKSMADTVVSLPHTESLEWKNDIYTREWAWCDALFMGPPALGYLTQATGNSKYLDQAVRLWLKTTAYLYDKDEHLYYRDSRYFNKKEKNGTKIFWSRGNGWVMGGLARLLSVMPENHPNRDKLVTLFKQMAAKLASVQQADGSWHASLLDPEDYPSKETSGTGLICYAMAWGINNGLLPYKTYCPVVSKAWNALASSVHPDGKLGFVQPQGAAPETVGYDDTDVYGTGAFLLAGSEMFRLNLDHEINMAHAEAYNGSSAEREQVIHISWQQILKKITKPEPKLLVAKDAASGEVIPVKINYQGRKLHDISITTQITAGACRFFQISNK